MTHPAADESESGPTRPVNRARMKLVERLLVEASDNDPRKVHEGSVRLYSVRCIDWAERTRRGLLARTGMVDMDRFWDLIEDSLKPYSKEADRG